MVQAGPESFPLDEASACRRRWLPFAAALESRFFGLFYALWLESGRPGESPRKADISPLHYPPRLLPHMLIIDVERAPLRFVYRLSGTKADRIHSRSLTGLYLDQLSPPSFARELVEDCAELVRTARPQFVELEFENEAGYRRHYDVMRLPLRGNTTETVDHILVISDHDEAVG